MRPGKLQSMGHGSYSSYVVGVTIRRSASEKSCARWDGRKGSPCQEATLRGYEGLYRFIWKERHHVQFNAFLPC